ncbi:hypothetical protein Lser_V15G29024 [Lactuca serriola]
MWFIPQPPYTHLQPQRNPNLVFPPYLSVFDLEKLVLAKEGLEGEKGSCQRRRRTCGTCGYEEIPPFGAGLSDYGSSGSGGGDNSDGGGDGVDGGGGDDGGNGGGSDDNGGGGSGGGGNNGGGYSSYG